MIAHLAGAGCEFFLPWLGFIGPAMVWMANRHDRDVVYHARQAMFFQLATSALCWTLTISGGLFSCFGLGFLIWAAEFPVWLMAWTIPMYGAMRVSNGEDFKYPLIGSMVRKEPPMLDGRE